MNDHKNCKFFGYKSCENKDNEIIKRATQDVPKIHGADIPIMSFPSHEEIDAICATCSKFKAK